MGCGKSSIAQTIAEYFAGKGRLVASYFFFTGSGDRSKLARFSATLASQLGAAIPAAAPFVENAATTNPGWLTSCAPPAQFERLFFEPFQAALRHPGRAAQALVKGPYLVVIDGLDECEDHVEIAGLVAHLIDLFQRHPRCPLRFLICSRVEERLWTCLEGAPQVRMINLVDHGASADIALVVDETFKLAAKHDRAIRTLGDWPSAAAKARLVKHADGSFIFMSTILRSILDSTSTSQTPMDRLDLALNIDMGLDGVYYQTLSLSKGLPHFSEIVSALAELQEPLSISELAHVLELELFDVVRVLVNLHAIIQVPGDDRTPVTLYHRSLREFLRDRSRAGEYAASNQIHKLLAYRALTLPDTDNPESWGAYCYVVDHNRCHWRNYVHSLQDDMCQLKNELREIIIQFRKVYPTDFCTTVFAICALVDPCPPGETKGLDPDFFNELIPKSIAPSDVTQGITYPLHHLLRTGYEDRMEAVICIWKEVDSQPLPETLLLYYSVVFNCCTSRLFRARFCPGSWGFDQRCPAFHYSERPASYYAMSSWFRLLALAVKHDSTFTAKSLTNKLDLIIEAPGSAHWPALPHAGINAGAYLTSIEAFNAEVRLAASTINEIFKVNPV